MASLTLTVAGVDRTEFLCQPDPGPALVFSAALRERKTLSCSFIRRTGSWTIQRGQHITLAHSVEGALFGGYITSVKRRKEGGANAGAVFFDVTAVDYRQILKRRRAAAFTYIDTAAHDIFEQVMDDSLIDEGFTVSIDDNGPVIPRFEVQSPRPTVEEAAEAICERASSGSDVFYFDIDTDKVIHFFKQDTNAAPFSITDANPYVLGGEGESAEAESDNEGKVNRVFAYLGQYLQTAVTESFVGDGSTRTFELNAPCGAKPSIKVNDVEIGDFIGVDGQSGYQWYWSLNSRTIRQDDGGTLLTGSDTLDVTYQAMDRLEVGPVEDAADASAEGVLQGDGTGIYEAMLTIETPQNLSDAETLMAAHLARYKRATTTFRGATYTSGLRAGQELAVELTDLGIDLSMLIKSVTMTDHGGGNFLWSFAAIYGAARDDWKRGFLGLEASSGIAGGGAAGSPTDALQISFAGSQGQQGVAFAASLIATGGVLPYAYSIASGSLPTGLSLDADTGKISGTPSAAGAFAFTGRVTDAASATADVSVTINITQPGGASVAATLSPITATDVTADRWQDGNGAVHAVIGVAIAISAYPRVVSIQTSSPQYGRINHGAFWVSGAGTIKVGAQTTNTAIYPPTNATSETVTVAVALGQYDNAVDISGITGAVTTTVSVAGPPAPGATEATGWYITSSTPTYDPGPGGANMFRFRIQGNLPITSSDGVNFYAARLCVQTKNAGGSAGGQRPNTMDPTDPKTVVGDYAGPTAFYLTEDHAANVKGNPSTGAIIWDIIGWTVPNDGYDRFHFEIWVSSRRTGGTWTKQNAWSSAAGTSTPGTNSSQSLTVDGTKARITEVRITTGQGDLVIDSASDGIDQDDGAGGHTSKLYPGYLSVDGPGPQGATLDAQGGSYSLAGDRWIVDSDGVLDRYKNVATTGRGMAAFVYSAANSGLSGNTTLNPGVGSGKFRVNLAINTQHSGGSLSGLLTLTVRHTWTQNGTANFASAVFAYFDSLLAARVASSVAIRGGDIISLNPVVIKTDNSTSGGITGIQIDFVASSITNWTYEYDVTIEKLAD